MDISVLILLAVICVAIAVLIGYLLGSIFSSKSSKPPPEAQKTGLVYRIGFYTDQQGRRFVLEMDGKTINAPHLLGESEHRRLVLLFQALGNWLNIEPNPPVKPSQTTLSVEGVESTSLPLAKAGGELPTQDAALFPNAPDASGVSSAYAPSARQGIVNWFAQAMQPRESVSQTPKSIAMQVDEILQRKLQEKGWQQRGIRLLELPNKGLVVMVGLDQYATVEDVPDAEIQAILRASVREWETKMYGG